MGWLPWSSSSSSSSAGPNAGSSSPAAPGTASSVSASPLSSSSSSSQDASYRPLKRDERKKCWEARDSFFGCLDKSNIVDAVKDSEAAESNCGRESALFEQDCASSWVIYFKNKRVADEKKAQQIKKLEAEGAIPVEKAQQESKWKLW